MRLPQVRFLNLKSDIYVAPKKKLRANDLNNYRHLRFETINRFYPLIRGNQYSPNLPFQQGFDVKSLFLKSELHGKQFSLLLQQSVETNSTYSKLSNILSRVYHIKKGLLLKNYSIFIKTLKYNQLKILGNISVIYWKASDN